jgi:hypothetical protein
MPSRMLDRLVDGKEVGDQRFVRRTMAEIGRDRSDDFPRVAPRHARHARKAVAPDRERGRHVGVKRRPHPLAGLPQRRQGSVRRGGERNHRIGRGGVPRPVRPHG